MRTGMTLNHLLCGFVSDQDPVCRAFEEFLFEIFMDLDILLLSIKSHFMCIQFDHYKFSVCDQVLALQLCDDIIDHLVTFYQVPISKKIIIINITYKQFAFPI